MKYRVVRENLWFYPQYKVWYCLWWSDYVTTAYTKSWDDPNAYEEDDFSYTCRVRFDNLADAVDYCIPKIKKYELLDKEIAWESHKSHRITRPGPM